MIDPEIRVLALGFDRNEEVRLLITDRQHRFRRVESAVEPCQHMLHAEAT